MLKVGQLLTHCWQILPQVADRRPLVSFISKMLNKLVGERDWSAQEVSHILLKIPQQQSTRQYSVLDCRPELGHDRHVMIDENNMARDALSAYKRYKQRLTHVNGGNHLLDVSLLDWLQLYSWDKHTSVLRNR
jgi:serine/threonine protein kinase